MKKILLALAASTFLAGSANAVLLDNHFKKYGYTQPESIISIQNKIDNGVYTQYPHIAGKSATGLFEDKLKPGTAIPQVLNGNRLLNALQNKRVIVADVKACLPIFAELARQNGVSCDRLINFLEMNSKDDIAMFSNLANSLNKITQKLEEMVSSDVQEEVNEEVSKEIDLQQEIIDAGSLADLSDEVANEYVEKFNITPEEFQALTTEVQEIAEEVERAVSPAVQEAVQAIVDVISNSLSGEITMTISNDLIADVTTALGSDYEISITDNGNGSSVATISEY